MSDLSMRVAEALVQEGTRFAFGITGSGQSLALISELERNGVRYYDVPHEGAAAIMAGTIARRSGKPAVSVSIKGPGLANMLPGIAHNFFESNPAISISEAYAPSVTTARQHKRIDQPAMVRPLVKAVAGDVSSLDEMRRYIQAASREAPGPVHFELAQGAASDCLEHATRTVPATHAFRPLLERIKGASRPVVIVGSVGMRRNWGTALSKLRVPVFTTASAKSLVDERGACAAGVYTGDGKARSPEARVLPKADLAICMGVRDREVLSPWSRDLEVVGIDEIAGSTGFPFSQYHSTASADDFVELIDALGSKAWGEDVTQQALSELRSSLAAEEWQPFHCFEALQKAQISQTLVCDTGSFCTIAEHSWIASSHSQYLGSSNGRYMGVSLPMAVAVSLSERAQPVVCAVGDGGIRAYPAILKLAVEEKLKLCVVLMRDSQYGSIACAAGHGHSTNAVRVAQPSWASTISGMGIDAAVAANPAEFESALSRWNHDAPFFIEAVFDADAYRSITEGVR